MNGKRIRYQQTGDFGIPGPQMRGTGGTLKWIIEIKATGQPK